MLFKIFFGYSDCIKLYVGVKFFADLLSQRYSLAIIDSGPSRSYATSASPGKSLLKVVFEEFSPSVRLSVRQAKTCFHSIIRVVIKYYSEKHLLTCRCFCSIKKDSPFFLKNATRDLPLFLDPRCCKPTCQPKL